jgi:hypothetical protein
MGLAFPLFLAPQFNVDQLRDRSTEIHCIFRQNRNRLPLTASMASCRDDFTMLLECPTANQFLSLLAHLSLLSGERDHRWFLLHVIFFSDHVVKLIWTVLHDEPVHQAELQLTALEP